MTEDFQKLLTAYKNKYNNFFLYQSLPTNISINKFIIYRHKMSNSSSQSINHQELFSIIEQSRQLIKPMKFQESEHVVIFQGFSGVGKSSMILTLSGQNMVGYSHPKSKAPILMSKEMDGIGGIKIEKKTTAGTAHPACISMDQRLFKEEVILWDMPGIGENRGLTQSLLNSYYYSKIFQSHPSIKIAFALTQSSIDPGNKGINLQNIFGDFIKIFGDVDVYEKYIILVITKANKFFEKSDALAIFEELKELPSIKSDQKVSKFLSKIVGGVIPILVFKQPDLGSDFIKQQKPKDLANQYQLFIEEFYRTVISVEKSHQLKLSSPAMSQEQAKKVLALADKTKIQLEKEISQLCLRLSIFFKSCSPAIEEISSLTKIKAAVNYIRTNRHFIAQFRRIIAIDNHSDKQQLKKKFLELNKILSNLQCSILNPKKQQTCPTMDKIEYYLGIMNFLNYNNFNKRQAYYWIDQDFLMKKFFAELQKLKIDEIWNQNVEIAFKQTITSIMEKMFAEHLLQFQNSDIYLTWLNSFRYFPSFFLQISKYMPSKKLKQKSNIETYVNYLHKMENNVGIRAIEIQNILKIFYLTNNLDIKWKEELIVNKFASMIKQKQEELIKNTIKYETWSEEFVSNILEGYIKTGNGQKMICDQIKKKNRAPQFREIRHEYILQRMKFYYEKTKDQQFLKLFQIKDLLHSKINNLKAAVQRRYAQNQKKEHVRAFQRNLLERRIINLQLQATGLKKVNNQRQTTLRNSQIRNAQIKKTLRNAQIKTSKLIKIILTLIVIIIIIVLLSFFYIERLNNNLSISEDKVKVLHKQLQKDENLKEIKSCRNSLHIYADQLKRCKNSLQIYTEQLKSLKDTLELYADA